MGTKLLPGFYMTIVTPPYFFGHLNHLHKFRQWVKSAMFQPKSRQIPWDYVGFRPNHHCVSWVQLVVRPVWVFHNFGKNCHPKSLTNFVDHKCPHLTIQTSFSSSYSQQVPLLWWRGNVDPAIPAPGPSLSAMLAPTGGSSRPRSRHPAHHESKASSPPAGCEGRRRIHPTHPIQASRSLVSSTKNGVVSTSGVESFLKFKFLVQQKFFITLLWRNNFKSMTPPPS